MVDPGSLDMESSGSTAQEGATRVKVTKVTSDRNGPSFDVIVVEEPLEIQMGFSDQGKRIDQPISITMRTPGHDGDLAVGFLFTEGIISAPDQIESIHHVGDALEGRLTSNTIRVDLHPSSQFDREQMEKRKRTFFTSSSCGVCGTASLDSLRVSGCSTMGGDDFKVAASIIHELPDRLRAAQTLFDETGGLHAAGLFDDSGNAIHTGEDVGRHNAVDKVIGHAFLRGKTPLAKTVMVVSGRTSFEILQKAAMAGIPFVVAVGAPSSLAVELAEQFGITLVGFTRNQRYNIYSGTQRIRETAT